MDFSDFKTVDEVGEDANVRKENVSDSDDKNKEVEKKKECISHDVKIDTSLENKLLHEQSLLGCVVKIEKIDSFVNLNNDQLQMNDNYKNGKIFVFFINFIF